MSLSAGGGAGGVQARTLRSGAGGGTVAPVSIEPLFSVGLMADLQYADADNGLSFVEKTVRRYRQSLDILLQGAREFGQRKTSINILLGDLLDFKAKESGEGAEAALAAILGLTTPRENWHFIVGNHDLSVFSRPRLHTAYLPLSVQAATPPTGAVLYYSHKPFPGFRFLFLDPFEVSSINAASEAFRKDAEDLIVKNNPNLRPGAPADANWFTNVPPERQRFVPFNGMISSTQLRWMLDEVAAATREGEKVLVFSHLPVHSACADPAGLMWNSEQVLKLLQRNRCVVAWVSGHDHRGGYAVDECGVHHIVPPAPLECAEGQTAYGVLELGVAGAHLRWRGKLPSNPSQPWPTTLVWR